MRTSKRLTPILLAVGAAALLGACGDDDGGGNPDARPMADAMGTPDAPPPPPTPTRDGTIALTEVKLTTPGNPNIGGAAISITFDDVTMGGGELVYGSEAAGQCSVRHFTVGGANPPSPTVNVGDIILSNATPATPAILGPVPTKCEYVNGDYECPVETRTALAGVIAVAGDPKTPSSWRTQIVFTGQEFPANYRGTWVRISGAAGGAAIHNGDWPVVAVASSTPDAEDPPLDTLVVLNQKPPAAPVPFAAVSARFLVGFNPIPTGADTVPFLDGKGSETTERVKIALAGSAENRYPRGIDITLTPGGVGFVLATACANCKEPHQLPTSIAAEAPDDGDAAVFSCNTAGGNCGSAGKPNEAFAISGIASDGDLTPGEKGDPPLPPFVMPPPVTRFATFTCSGLGRADVKIKNEMMRKILEVNPTRIETRVFRIGAPFPAADAETKNTFTVLAGHGLIGHTTIPD